MSKSTMLKFHKRLLRNAKINLKSAKEAKDKSSISYWEKAIKRTENKIKKLTSSKK